MRKDLLQLGMLIDKAKSLNDVPKIREYLDILKNYVTNDLRHNEKIYFHYIYAIALCDLRQHTTSPNEKLYNQPLVDQELYHLRVAENICLQVGVNGSEEDVSLNSIKSHIYTNLGNLYDHTGRFVEAMRSWQLALHFTPEFAMAEFNIGFSLMNTIYYYEAICFEDLKYLSYYYMNKYKNDWRFQRNYPAIEEYYNGMYQNAVIKPSPKPLQLSDTKEDLYRYWCVSNCLYLNPYNDIDSESTLSLTDNLYYQELILLKEEYFKHNTLIHIFNQIKQEYVSARYMLYCYFEQSGVKHFSDNEVFLADLNDYSEISYNTELAKSSFRSLYSILDKIAYFLNVYLDLNICESVVDFKKIWFSDSKCKHLRVKIREEDNFPLMALYYIRKDLFCHEDGFITSPEARLMQKIRNYMEHKCFVLVDGTNEYFEEKDSTLYLSRSLFESKAYHLITIIRASIIYLKNVVTVREYNRKNEIEKIGNLIPIYVGDIDPEYRV
jgi:hypothetical protein